MPARHEGVGASATGRLRQRLFQPWSHTPKAEKLEPFEVGRSHARSLLPRRDIGFQASIAEFLLINRLRARRPTQPSADVLERAAHVVFVTCQNWFGKSTDGADPSSHRTRL
jgi:hypothetical protein